MEGLLPSATPTAEMLLILTFDINLLPHDKEKMMSSKLQENKTVVRIVSWKFRGKTVSIMSRPNPGT